VSRYAFTKDDKTGIRGFKFRATVNKKRFMMGFNQKSTSEHHNDLDFSLYFNSNNQVSVYEKGSNKGIYGRWQANSVGEVVITPAGEVRYIVDGEAIYTSKTAPTFPLYADISMHDEGTKLDSIEWIGDMTTVDMKVGNKVQFSGFKYLASDKPGNLRKVTTVGNGWNAGAKSMQQIDGKNDVRGFSFIPLQNNKHFMIGLNDKSSGESYQEINYAVYCRSDKNLGIYQAGSSKGNFGTYNAGDKIELLVTKGDSEVVVRVNGVVRYTFSGKPSLPLIVDASFYHTDGKIKDATWIADKSSTVSMRRRLLRRFLL
jgi:hypothetical protein